MLAHPPQHLPHGDSLAQGHLVELQRQIVGDRVVDQPQRCEETAATRSEKGRSETTGVPQHLRAEPQLAPVEEYERLLGGHQFAPGHPHLTQAEIGVGEHDAAVARVRRINLAVTGDVDHLYRDVVALLGETIVEQFVEIGCGRRPPYVGVLGRQRLSFFFRLGERALTSLSQVVTDHECEAGRRSVPSPGAGQGARRYDVVRIAEGSQRPIRTCTPRIGGRFWSTKPIGQV